MKNNNLLVKFLKFSYGSWLGFILGVATTMLITRILSPEEFGKVSMFDLSLKIGMILTLFGTDQSFVRFFYEEKPNLRGALLYNSLRIPMISSIIMIMAILFLYRPITNFLIGEVDFGFAIVFATGVIFQLLFRYAQLVIRMEQKGHLYSLLQICQKVFYLTLIIIFYLMIGSTFDILVYSRVITLLLLSIIAIHFGRNFWKLRNIRLRKRTKHSQYDIFRYGAPFVLTIFITWLFESFDKIALRQWSTFEELGLYSGAMKLVALVMILRTTFSTFWTPVSYEKFEKDPEDREFFRYITSIVSFAMFFVAILSIAGRDLIVLLLGSEYKLSATIMTFLVLMPILYTISETTVIGINFYKKSKWHILIAMISCVANIIGNWLMVPEYGAIGASVSTAFSFIIFFTLRTQISLRYYKVNYPLFKIYSMTFIIIVYALYAIFNTSFSLNIIISVIPLTLLFILYYKDIIYIYKNRKRLFN